MKKYLLILLIAVICVGSTASAKSKREIVGYKYKWVTKKVKVEKKSTWGSFG